MSTSLRSRLFTFALTVAVAAIAAGPAGAIIDESRRGPNAVVPTPAPTRGERAVTVALEAVGTPYRWGGESPVTGFDWLLRPSMTFSTARSMPRLMSIGLAPDTTFFTPSR